jgi:hypothetical protein
VISPESDRVILGFYPALGGQKDRQPPMNFGRRDGLTHGATDRTKERLSEKSKLHYVFFGGMTTH